MYELMKYKRTLRRIELIVEANYFYADKNVQKQKKCRYTYILKNQH